MYGLFGPDGKFWNVEPNIGSVEQAKKHEEWLSKYMTVKGVRVSKIAEDREGRKMEPQRKEA